MSFLQDQYRSSTEYREILRILQKATTLQENFLWQSDAIGKNIIPIHHFEIDFVTREVVVFFDSEHFKINFDLPLYVKLDYRTSVFKVSKFKQSHNTVHFGFPLEIKTIEMRANPRLPFSSNQDKYIGLKSSMTHQIHKDMGNELIVRVADVSKSGLGLIISEQNRSFLKNNRILWITRLQNENLAYPILAEVAYISNEVDQKFQTRKQKELRVGLKLSGVFTDDVLNRFIQ